jgi:hypothetical protein
MACPSAGAAGVSPPWVELAFATVTRFCALLTFRTAHSFPVPRLTGASRSRCTTDIRCNMRFCNAKGHIRKSGGRKPAVGVSNAVAIASAFVSAAHVSPPWVANRVCDGNEVSLPVSSSHAEGIARGAYVPRSWCMERRSSAGRTTSFAMQKRTFAGAAGVSPPWV